MDRSLTSCKILSRVALLCLLLFPSSARQQEIKGAELVVVHNNEMGSAYKLVELSYLLDDQPLYYRTVQDAPLGRYQQEEITRVAVGPGHHRLHVLMLYQGQGQGVFSYLQGYKFKVSSEHEFRAAPRQQITVEVTGYEHGGPDTPLDERPAVRWTERKEPPDPEGGAASRQIQPRKKLPRFVAEGGFDFDYLFWEDGRRFTFGWAGAFGVRLFDKLYGKVKVVVPMFFLFAIVGNHTSVGGELEYQFLDPAGGVAQLGLKVGAAYNWHVNRYCQLLGPESPEPSECSSGLKTWAALRLGMGVAKIFFFLDLGVDLKRMDVKNQYAISRGNWFVGPYAGFAIGGWF